MRAVYIWRGLAPRKLRNASMLANKKVLCRPGPRNRFRVHAENDG